MRKYLAILAVGILLSGCTATAVTASMVITAVQATCGFTLVGGIDVLISKYKTVDAIRDFVCGLVGQQAATALMAPPPKPVDPSVDREVGIVDGVPITGHFAKP